MASNQNLLYLSDLRPGDLVRCRVGLVWNCSTQERTQHLFDISGQVALFLESVEEDGFLLSTDGKILHVIDHYNEPTRWEFC